MSLRKDLVVIKPKKPTLLQRASTLWKHLLTKLERKSGFQKYRVIRWYHTTAKGMAYMTTVEYQNVLNGEVLVKEFRAVLDWEAVRLWIATKR